MNIVFDIETMPNSSMIERLPEPEIKMGNLAGTTRGEWTVPDGTGKQ